MKQLRHVLSLTLAVLMVLGMVTPMLAASYELSVENDYEIPVESEDDSGFYLDVVSENDEDELSVLPKEDYETDDTADTNEESAVTYSMSIVHVDCGRKYFTVDELKSIIDNAAAAGFNYVELAVGNDGLRFLLDDMSLTVNGTTYTDDAVTSAIEAGNVAYSTNKDDSTDKDGVSTALTETEMDTIIAYANSKNISIIPLINTPGHMDAILAAAESLTGVQCDFDNSTTTIDVTNTTAVAFTQALLQKYIDYFSGKDCKYFNIGADEYGNDVYTGGGMGFAQIKDTKYTNYVEYVNAVNEMVKDKNMTSMMFNDGVMYGKKTGISTDILVCYWTSGWSGYEVSSASALRTAGYKLINTHGDYYWTLGKSKCTAEKAAAFDETVFMGSTVNDPIGAMFCIWCDVPSEYNVSDKDGVDGIITATAPVIAAFGAKLPAVTSDDSGNNDGTVTEVSVELEVNGDSVSKTVTGGDYTNNIDTTGYDSAIAEYTTSYTEGSETKAVLTTVDETYTGVIRDADGNYMTVSDSGTVGHTDKQSEATQFTVTVTKAGDYNTSYYVDIKTADGKYYLNTNSDTKLITAASSSNVQWRYSTSKGSLYYALSSSWGWSTTSYYIKYDGTNWGITTSSDYSSNNYTCLYEVTPASTTVTFTGKAEGTTQLKVGNTLFNITVLAQIETIDIEYWITNATVTANSAIKMSLSNARTGVSTADGVLVSELVPQTGVRTLQTSTTVAYWKTTRLTSDEKQEDNGQDRTSQGDDFAYIRYYDGAWSFSNDRKTWTAISTTDQIVAYYLQITDVTEEIQTQVVDWGEPVASYTWGNNFVLLDYAVKYEDGTLSPNTFKNTKTIGFHCDYTASAALGNTVFYDDTDTTTSNGYWFNYYRRIGMTRAVENDQGYEVYLITVTPYNDSHSSGIYLGSTYSSSASTVGTFTYTGTEQAIWAIDDAALVGFDTEDKQYTSISGNYKLKTGGTPTIDGLEIYNHQAMLVTYYIRAKQTEDSLTVHYRLATKNTDGTYKYSEEDFYHYYITVNSGTTFSSNFTFNKNYTDIDNALSNNTVINTLKKEISAEPNLTKLSEMSAYFAYADYKLVNAELSGDMKEVFLYYYINDDPHDYVVDFGSSVVINSSDVIKQTGWESVQVANKTALKYGTAVLDSNGTTLTYTANKIIQGKEQIVINVYKTVDGEATNATHYINIYPATNVLYEETVITEQNLLGITDPANTWETVEGTSKVGNQQLEALDNDGKATNVYGYDDIYSEDTGFSGDSYYKATLTATDMQAATDTALSFTFTGTGFDLISECGPQTGCILVRLSTLNDNGTKTLIKGYFVDTYFVGDGTIINSDNADDVGVLDYQVPVVRDLDLAYDTYAVDIYGYVYPKTTASTNSVGKMISTESIVSEALDTLGLDDSVEMYEISYMDENSVLNGGVGISETSVVKDVYESDVISDNMMNAYMYEDLADEKNEAATTTGYVYIDGVRVYGTMGTTLDKDGGYKADERGTKYYNVYDFVNQSAQDFTTETDFIMYVEYDGNGNYVIQDYKNQGPENEIYLTDGHGVAFILDGYSGNIGSETVQLAMKVVKGEAGTVDFSVSDEGYDESVTVQTNTEMYYKASVRSSTINGETVKYVLLTVSADEGVVISISGLKVSSCITPVANVELANEVIKYNSKTSDFVPDTFTVKNVKSVKSGKYFSVSVSTSTDANKVEVTVNGTTYELDPNNMKAVTSGTAKCYKYSKTIQAPTGTSGDTFEVSVVACKADDNTVKSEPVTMTVTIK